MTRLFRASFVGALISASVLTACGGGGDSGPAPPIVTTPVASVFAGGNPAFVYPTGYLDGPGNVATFRNAYGMAVALDGSILVADIDNQRIRRIDGSGTVSTVATVSFQNVGLLGPLAVTVSEAGKIYTRSSVFRLGDSPTPVLRIDTDGRQTVLGTAERGTGIAVDAAENVFVPVGASRKLDVFLPDGGKRALDLFGSVFSDRNGTVYIAIGGSVGTIDATGKISYLLNPVPAEVSSFYQFTRDDNGNFYFVTVAGVFKVTPPGSVTKLLALPDPLIRAPNLVNAMLWNAGALYLTVQDGRSIVVRIAPAS